MQKRMVPSDPEYAMGSICVRNAGFHYQSSHPVAGYGDASMVQRLPAIPLQYHIPCQLYRAKSENAAWLPDGEKVCPSGATVYGTLFLPDNELRVSCRIRNRDIPETSTGSRNAVNGFWCCYTFFIVK
jgi:type III secretion system FlhB-like substrate exporter